ncbi:MAG: amidohydrolase [Acidimicrobiales bacterium]
MSVVSSDSAQRMRSWRRSLHRRPELGFDVGHTAETVAQLLHEFGVDEIHTGIGGTGVVGVVRSGTSDRAIALRADMDALPIQEANEFDHRSQVDGAFHGCGHDGHTAMLLGAAEVLAAERSFDGTVVLIFQPDEENGHGAQAMLDDGMFERFPVNAAYGMHNKPGLPVGKFATRVGSMMSSEDLFELVITGSGGHASMPEKLVDPIVVAGELISSLQTIVSRSVAAIDTAVVSITEILTDGARNIVPSTVTIRGDCRTFSSDVQATIEARIRQLASGAAVAHGAEVSVSYTHEFVPLVNTAAEVENAVAAATALVGAENVDGDCEPWPASEDFARLLDVVPGCYIDIGNGIEGHCANTLHNPSYDFNDDILDLGARYWVELVGSQL